MSAPVFPNKRPRMQTLRKLEASLGAALDDSAKFMFIIFSAAGLLLCLGYQFLAIPHRYSLDYGEAPLDLTSLKPEGTEFAESSLTTTLAAVNPKTPATKVAVPKPDSQFRRKSDPRSP